MSLEKKELNVVGMHCPSCAIAVELSIKDLDGVKDSKADLNQNKVEVEFLAEKVSDIDLAKAVEEAGFKVN
jgi:copper chaperone CopZ